MTNHLHSAIDNLVLPMYKKGKKDVLTDPFIIVGEGDSPVGALIVKSSKDDNTPMNDSQLFDACNEMSLQLLKISENTTSFIIVIGEFIKNGKRYVAAEQSSLTDKAENLIYEITENDENLPVLRESNDDVLSDSIVRKTGSFFWKAHFIHNLSN